VAALTHAPPDNYPKCSKSAQYATFSIIHHHNELLMGAPPVFTSLLYLSGISIIRARTSSIMILLHLSYKTTLYSSSVFHTLFRTHCFNMFQIPSIGFKSGDYGGRRRTKIQFDSKNTYAMPLFLLPWLGSPSSYRTQGLSSPSPYMRAFYRASA
jgi:hypothetical protein